MITLTEQEIQNKFISLPQKIQNALLSENIMTQVRYTCGAHNLTDPDKVSVVEQLVGLILLGFIPAANLAQEISKELKIDFGQANAIAADINRRIFTPLNFAVEKAEVPSAPAATVEEKPAFAEAEESRKVELRFKPGTAPTLARQVKPQETTAPAEEKIEAPAERVEAKAEEAPAPFVIDLGAKKTPEMPISPPAPAAPPRPPEAAPAEAVPSAPFILHKEAELKPILESEKPRVSVPTAARTKEAPTFRVEITEDDKKKEIAVAKTAPPKSRIVHYVGPKTSLFPAAVPPPPEKEHAAPKPPPVVSRVEPSSPPPPPKFQGPKPLRQDQGEPAAEEVIDLSSFRKVQKANKTGPQIEGNTVDLR